MSELKKDIKSALGSVAKDWKKAKRQADKEDRVGRRQLGRMRSYRPTRQTIRDASFQVMEKAINKASGNGRYMANARQVMYAARPYVMEITGGEIWRNSAYFTQNILKDYIEYRGSELTKKIVWDARGHITEPHTRKVVPLGGVGVMEYKKKWAPRFDEYATQESMSQIKTSGPSNRYGNVLFIEKEGFSPILEDAGIAEKYDIAIMSTKGIPVKAACDLVSGLAGDVNILVLHDFDLDGFKIVNTLRYGTRLSRGADVIDIGLRLDDVEGLISESVHYRQKKDPRYLLRDYGVTNDECSFLVRDGGGYYRGWSGERVELNAMTSDQLIEYLERKFEEHGVEKVIPDDETLSRAYKRAVFLQAIDREIKDIKERLMNENGSIPEDLKEQVKEIIEGESTAWDDAIWEIAEEKQDAHE